MGDREFQDDETGGVALGPPGDGRLDLGEVVVDSTDTQTCVVLSGEVDMALSARLEVACRDAMARALPIQVDVSRVAFIDSTAIGFVVQLAGAERDAGRTLRVSGATRRTAETFRLTGLGELLELD